MSSPIAIVGSSGLRSIGIISIGFLIRQLKARPIAKIHSPHFPLVYQTRPSYATHPDLPGLSGVRLEKGVISIPSVEVYESDSPKLLLTKGYHANFQGQYEVAEQVLDLHQQYGVKRLFVLAGYGVGEGQICCAATSKELVNEMSEHGIQTGYKGPLMGFSGIVLGLACLRGMEGICLFGRSEPNPEDPELPDPEAAKTVLEKIAELLKLDVDVTKIEDYAYQRNLEVISF